MGDHQYQASPYSLPSPDSGYSLPAQLDLPPGPLPPGPSPMQGPQAQFVEYKDEPVQHAALQPVGPQAVQVQQVVQQHPPQQQVQHVIQHQPQQHQVVYQQQGQPVQHPPPQQQTVYMIQQPQHHQQPVQVQQQPYQGYPPPQQHHHQQPPPQQHYQQQPPQQHRPVYQHQPQYVNVVRPGQPQGPPQQGQQRVIRVLHHQPRARMHYVDSGRQMVPQNAQGQQPGQRVMILRPANNHPGQQPQHRIQGQVGPRIVGPGHPQGGQPRYQQMQVVRPMHPGQQQRPIRVMQHHQQPQVQPPQRPRPQYHQQYHPRPPGPPQPGQPQGQPINVQGPPGAPGGPSGEVILNVEHHFMDNGKLVKKMPIEMEGQIIWVDCADEEQVPKDDKNNLVLDFPAPGSDSPGPSSNSPNPTLTAIGQVPTPGGGGGMGLGQPIKRQAKDFTDAEKAKIVDECTVEMYSPTLLAEKYNINVTSIRGWIKSAGKTLPQKYKFNATKQQTKPPTPSSAQSMSPAVNDPNAPNQTNNPNNLMSSNVSTSGQSQNSEETITLYAGGAGSNENSRSDTGSPPQQIVRQPQLLVTDGSGQVPGSGPNQLQLPQRPTPPGGLPNLPKPVPSQAAAHKPKIIPGKVAVCSNCGGYSTDLAKCTGCKRMIKEGAKIMPDPDYKPPPSENANSKKSFMDMKGGPGGGSLRDIRLQQKPGRRKANSDEPECIALSSDEDEGDEENDGEDGDKNLGVDANGDATGESKDESGENGVSKPGDGEAEEVSEFNPGPASQNEPRITSMITNLKGLINGNSSQQFTTLTCRSIRVGSYKILTKERVFFTEKAIYLKVPFLTDVKKIVTIVIPVTDILRIEMLSGRSMPLLFISTTPSTCDRVRKDLNLNFKSSGLYFDLSSSDETMKRITMLPEKMPDEVKNMLTNFYGAQISELDNKSANEMLVRSTPKTSAISQQQQLQKSCGTGGDSSSTGLGRKEPAFNSVTRVEKYCQFEGQSVTLEDYYCLEDESFLNDVIIDFYFKWIQHKILKETTFKDNIHVFTTYFYKRLTTRPPRSKTKLHPVEDNVNLSLAEKRYERVRRWTKKVNIFEKDFVIVPINEHSHWFVAVICYPGLVGKRRMDNNEVIPESEDPDKLKQDEKEKDKLEKVKAAKKKVMQIGSTSIIPLNKNASNFHGMDDDDDKDEAEASDSEMVVEDPEEDKKSPSTGSLLLKSGSTPPKTPSKEETSPKTDESADFKNAFDAIDKELKNADSPVSNNFDSIDKELGADETETKTEGEEKKAAGDESTVKNNLDFSLPKPVKNNLEFDLPKPVKTTDEKEALAKADNEPTTTTTDTEVKPDTEVTPGDSGKKPESPPKSPDQSESKSDIKPEKTIEEAIALKQPCILIFDSLQTGLRSRVVATLREYLQCEYKAKMKEDREFTIHNFKGASPKVPQQPNFSDCGLFALQYVESFLTKPLTDYTLPMKGLRKWFPSEVMRNKRAEIAKIIRDLAMEQNKDGKEIDFPPLTFTPDSGSGYTDDEGDSEMKSATSKVLMKTPNRFMVKSNAPQTTTTRVICLTSSKSLTLTPSKSNSGTTNSGAPMIIQRKKGKIEYFSMGNKNQNSSGNNTTPKKSGSLTLTGSGTKSYPGPYPSLLYLHSERGSRLRKSETVNGGATPKKLPGVTTVLIPKLTGTKTAGQKVVKKDMTNAEMTKNNSTNGPSATSSGDTAKTSSKGGASKSLVANYSDNSSGPEEGDTSRNQSRKTSPSAGEGALDMEVDEDGAPVISATPMLKRPSPDSTSSEENPQDSAKKAKVDNVDDEEGEDGNNATALVTSSNDA